MKFIFIIMILSAPLYAHQCKVVSDPGDTKVVPKVPVKVIPQTVPKKVIKVPPKAKPKKVIKVKPKARKPTNNQRVIAAMKLHTPKTNRCKY